MDLSIIFKTIKSIILHEGFSNTKSAIHEELKILSEQHMKENEIVSSRKAKGKQGKKRDNSKVKNKKEKNKKEVLVGSGV